ERLSGEALAHLSEGDGDAAPLNTTSFARWEVVERAGGDTVVASCPSYGVGEIVQSNDAVSLEEDRYLTPENGQLRAVLTQGGSVLSIIEKETGYEALREPGNRLELYHDRPIEEEAWNVDPYHLESCRECPPAETYQVLSDGPLRAEVAFER